MQRRTVGYFIPRPMQIGEQTWPLSCRMQPVVVLRQGSNQTPAQQPLSCRPQQRMSQNQRLSGVPVLDTSLTEAQHGSDDAEPEESSEANMAASELQKAATRADEAAAALILEDERGARKEAPARAEQAGEGGCKESQGTTMQSQTSKGFKSQLNSASPRSAAPLRWVSDAGLRDMNTVYSRSERFMS